MKEHNLNPDPKLQSFILTLIQIVILIIPLMSGKTGENDYKETES